MFYTFAYTPVITDTEANPKKIEMQLTAGIIHQVDVLFQDGCCHKEFVQIFKDAHQAWPSNRGEKLRGNATVVSFRDFFELTPGNADMTAKIWTTLTSGWKEIIIQIGILPKSILQPLSFKELMAAATGVKK